MTDSKKMLSRARRLRHDGSDAENLLWQQLRGRRLDGYKFRRQFVIEPYIVDFVCLEARLIIEADGGQHLAQGAYDEERSLLLQSMGFTILRFWNNQILVEQNSVLEQIKLALNEISSTISSPAGKGPR